MNILKKIKTLFKKEDAPIANIIRLASVDSTNNYIRSLQTQEGSDEMTVVVADYQTEGRGQGTNKWESEAEKNLLFSLLLHPKEVPVGKQFLLSEYGALCLKEVLDEYVGGGIALKWPNDIYWKDQKLCGTLIEMRLSGGRIKDCVFGIGLNVNQTVFTSDAPNPVSLAQILRKEVDKDDLLLQIIHSFNKNYEWIRSANYATIVGLYHNALYRGNGFHPFEDAEGKFEGAIIEVEDDGHLILRDRSGEIRSYAFKEIKYGKI